MTIPEEPEVQSAPPPPDLKGNPSGMLDIVETGRVAELVRTWEQRSPRATAHKKVSFDRGGGGGGGGCRPCATAGRRLPSELFDVMVRYLAVEDRPVVNRAAMVSYVAKKNRRLNATPLLVDIWWHGGTCLGRYCVCRAVSQRERLECYREEGNPGANDQTRRAEGR